jgi:hypothetical protein
MNSGNSLRALPPQALGGSDRHVPTSLVCHQGERDGHTTPKPLVQSECESDRLKRYPQCIGRSLSARSEEPASGVGGDAPLVFPLSIDCQEVAG